MFRQHKRHLSSIKTKIRLVSDDFGLLLRHLAISNLALLFLFIYFLMKALKKEACSFTDSLLNVAIMFSTKSGCRSTSGISHRVSDVRGSVFRPSHTPSASKYPTKLTSLCKVVYSFIISLSKTPSPLFPLSKKKIKVPPTTAALPAAISL